MACTYLHRGLRVSIDPHITFPFPISPTSHPFRKLAPIDEEYLATGYMTDKEQRSKAIKQYRCIIAT